MRTAVRNISRRLFEVERRVAVPRGGLKIVRIRGGLPPPSPRLATFRDRAGRCHRLTAKAGESDFAFDARAELAAAAAGAVWLTCGGLPLPTSFYDEGDDECHLTQEN